MVVGLGWAFVRQAWKSERKLWQHFLFCFEAIAGVINGKWDKNGLIWGESSDVFTKRFVFQSQVVEKAVQIRKPYHTWIQAPSRSKSVGCWAQREFLAFSKIGNVWQRFLVKQHPRFSLWGCCQCSHTPWGCPSDRARFLPSSNLPSPHVIMDHKKTAYPIFLVQTLQQHERWWWKDWRHEGFS